MTTDSATAIYAVVRAPHDGRNPLIVGQFRNPNAAIKAAKILVARGFAVTVQLITRAE